MAKSTSLSVAELQSLLNEQRKRLDELKKKQSALQKELDAVNQEIASIEGGEGGARRVRRRRGRNQKPLRAYVQEVLTANKKGLALQEISEAVQANGYKTSSKNFKNVLYQCLYHNEEFIHDDKTGTYKIKA